MKTGKNEEKKRSQMSVQISVKEWSFKYYY